MQIFFKSFYKPFVYPFVHVCTLIITEPITRLSLESKLSIFKSIHKDCPGFLG